MGEYYLYMSYAGNKFLPVAVCNGCLKHAWSVEAQNMATLARSGYNSGHKQKHLESTSHQF